MRLRGRTVDVQRTLRRSSGERHHLVSRPMTVGREDVKYVASMQRADTNRESKASASSRHSLARTIDSGVITLR